MPTEPQIDDSNELVWRLEQVVRRLGFAENPGLVRRWADYVAVTMNSGAISVDGTGNLIRSYYGSTPTFSTAEPWMRVHDNYKDVNVAAQEKDPNSVLAFWKKMLRLRKEHADVLVYGQFEIFDYEDPNTFMYVKEYQGKEVLVALNFSDEDQVLAIPPSVKDRKLNPLIANVDHLGSKLSPWEARAYLVE